MRRIASAALVLLALPGMAPAAPSCVQGGDRLSLHGTLVMGRIQRPLDPRGRVDSYVSIVFDQPVCVITAAAPSGLVVRSAAFLSVNPVVPGDLGRQRLWSGDLEAGDGGTPEAVTFMAD